MTKKEDATGFYVMKLGTGGFMDQSVAYCSTRKDAEKVIQWKKVNSYPGSFYILPDNKRNK
jgi:hypothetical protein